MILNEFCGKWHFLKCLSLGLIFLLPCLNELSSQTIKWWNPKSTATHHIEGQYWPQEVAAPYSRLPARAEAAVRKPVWNLGKHAAGMMIRFYSNAPEIKVRYQVSGEHEMSHMPATGVSGVDLYAIDSNGEWMWCRGHREFKDSVRYNFSGLRENDGFHKLGREYRLYLPLYNDVQWMEIGVPDTSYFEALPVRAEKPIVIYGTSIAHGACASRPGMAWTNIVGRKMDRQVYNLAFSGNGRLESEVVNLVSEIDAKIFIIDCLPNVMNPKHYPREELMKRILRSVGELRAVHPTTPILLTDHAGYTDGLIVEERKQMYTQANETQWEAYQQLTNAGDKNLHYLKHGEIALGLDDMVDGTHPNDLGMQHYAEAYETKLREILNEPTQAFITTLPVRQRREPGNYEWEQRHREILEMNKSNPPKSVILANSIVHFWGGEPKARIARDKDSWDKVFTPGGLRNLAYGWDRVENVLWRVYHGELDGYEAENVVVMIGTNNLHLNSNAEIMHGLDLLVDAIRARQASAEIHLLGILPRRDQEGRVKTLNEAIAQLAKKKEINHDDFGHVFILDNGKIDETLFSDGLHPNEAGYKKLGPLLQELLELP